MLYVYLCGLPDLTVYKGRAGNLIKKSVGLYILDTRGPLPGLHLRGAGGGALAPPLANPLPPLNF